ncbi:hypothetical protein PRK78_007072 [Emydomyces testavorans]|uniref:HTH La-type RNA-binding domain-containing protein n=1 Tax=Emydomyces testavorans TaxID=2070801 RepID=A0AAF0DQP7_9EURO|nr:hypothetical protein PRK78_007072 [Emydomyces testavorans]
MATPIGNSATEMPSFSYAQAAKGLVSSTPAEMQSKSTTASAELEKVEVTDRPANNKDLTQSLSSSNEIIGVPAKEKLETEPDLNMSGASSPSVATASTETLPKEDDISLTPNGSSDSTWDKQSQDFVSIDKPNQPLEGNKEKASENGTEKNNSIVKELKPAPIPAVNIWQQRREAQEAKARANALSSTSPSSIVVTTKASGANPSSETRPDTSKGSNRRKSAETVGEKKKSGDASKKGGTRSHRSATELDSNEPIPPVADAASWPTPQLAQGEEQRRAQERIERAERVDKDKPVSSRTHGKEKWMPVPYVPTAVFSTPLPPGARRGGRATRGSREGGTHSNASTHAHSTGGEKTNVSSNAMSGSKHAHATDRRAVGDWKLTQGGRPNGPDATSDEKQSHLDEGRDGKSRNAEDNTQNPSSAESSSQYRRDSKTFGKSQESANPPHHQTTKQGGSHNEGHPRYGQNTERRFENGRSSADSFKESNPFSFRERDFGRDRDHQRADFHRERDYGRENRGELRSDRGRGSYRGRGNHSNYTGTQSVPFHSAPIPQHPFPIPKTFTFNNERHRMQQSGHQNGTQSNARIGLRSPSMPNHTIYGAAPYPIQTDVASMYAYPQVHQGPMTAIPYQPYMEQYSLVSMISMQLEYYFSVDNLCKDLFLRKHMDSQGFVLLTVIASFKRIKSLTEDMDLLRQVCRQLKNVDYRPGEDSLDRVRKREKWEQWILSMEMRDPSAQNDGPPPATTSQSIRLDSLNENGMTMEQDGYTHITNGASRLTSAAPPLSNAMLLDAPNNYVPTRSVKLSSAAREFSPLIPLTTQNENVSERNPMAEIAFPDEQIGNLVIVVRKPGTPSPAQSPFLSPSSRSFSSGCVDGCEAARGQLNAENRSSLVTCGAPLGSDRYGIRSTSFQLDEILKQASIDVDRRVKTASLTKCYSSIKSSEQVPGHMPTFWIKDKNAPIESIPPGLVHESYTVFRKHALDKRLSGSSGETSVDMDVLYQFWSHFLVRNFNSRMYNEFRNLAFDDVSSRNSTTGLQYLIKFYDGILSSNRVILDGIARDLIELVKSEASANEKPAFQQLRRVWRNGAFNLKSRKKIDGLIDESLRAELER